jgi:hypothetical protein
VTQREVLARCVDAFERYDFDVLCSILRADARRARGAVAVPSSRCRVG